MKTKVSAVILVKNAEKTLEKALQSVQFLDEIVVLENGSTDKSLDILRKFPEVKVISHSQFEGFGVLRNLAAEQAKNPWIFVLDSDEQISFELQEILKETELCPKTVYRFPFKNFFQGKWIRGCGWYPDQHVRLYHRSYFSFSQDCVHEKLCYRKEEVQDLAGHILHESYLSIDDFLRKMHVYSSLFADQSAKKSSFWKALLHGYFSFFKSYILQRGFLDGKEGYIISSYNAQVAYYKYLKLWKKHGS